MNRSQYAPARLIRITATTPLLVALLGGLFGLFAPSAWADSCSTPLKPSGIEHKVSVDGHPIALWEKSPAQPKATILLVHGRTWSGKPDFDLATACDDLSLMNGLVANGIATFAVDMRGYGNTPRDATGWLTPNRAAKDIAGVLRWLSKRQEPLLNRPHSSRPHLFGWSYGATMAQLTVQQEPDLAQSLTLFGYAVRKGYNKTPKAHSAQLQPQPQPQPPRAPNTYANAISDFIMPDSISAESIEAFASAALAADPIRADWNKLEQWRALDGRKVTIPTLLLQGESDPLTRKRVHKRLFKRIAHPVKKWVVLEGGDHAAFMETPRPEFIRHLTNFVLENQQPN